VVSTGAQRRDRLGFSTRRLRHLQFQPHSGRHRAAGRPSLMRKRVGPHRPTRRAVSNGGCNRSGKRAPLRAQCG